MKAALLALGLWIVLSPALRAQDGLRSASLPERPIATQPPGPDDLFRAGPDTYRPRPDRKPPRFEPSTGGLYWPYANVPQRGFRHRPEPPPEVGFLQLCVSPATAS